MPVLMKVPLDGDESDTMLIVEADRNDVRGEQLTLAAPKPGEVAAQASRSITSSLDDLRPLLRALKDKLVDAGPDEFSVEFGLKLGGETGIIIAKGTAEVNLAITMSWRRRDA